MIFSEVVKLRKLVFDQSSPVHPVSESRGGGTLSVTNEVRSPKDKNPGV